MALKDTDDRQRVLKQLNLALRIARRTIQFLGAKGFTGADLPEGNFAVEKPLAESAMLLYTAKEERSDPGIKEVFDGIYRPSFQGKTFRKGTSKWATCPPWIQNLRLLLDAMFETLKQILALPDADA